MRWISDLDDRSVGQSSWPSWLARQARPEQQATASAAASVSLLQYSCMALATALPVASRPLLLAIQPEVAGSVGRCFCYRSYRLIFFFISWDDVDQ